jgi:hypothetical protein
MLSTLKKRMVQRLVKRVSVPPESGVEVVDAAMAETSSVRNK